MLRVKLFGRPCRLRRKQQLCWPWVPSTALLYDTPTTATAAALATACATATAPGAITDSFSTVTAAAVSVTTAAATKPVDTSPDKLGPTVLRC